jgi:uncharacterized repeat protein (TIGR03806 family)
MGTERRLWMIAVVAFAQASAAYAQGLDVRPANPSCVAPPRPTAGEFRVELQPFFPSFSASRPVGMAQSPVDPSVWYVAELGGQLFRARTNVAGQTTALDLRDLIDPQGGLLGIALHPDFATNGQLFAYYTGHGNATIPFVSVLSRFTTSDGGLTFVKSSEQVILTLDQPTDLHTGGDIRFGPDGYLYLGFGDGGLVASPAQDPSQWFGTFVRIDVDGGVPYAIPPDNPFAQGGAGAPEVWAWGFRNPFRWSFDMLTGEIWAGDVGGALWEELDVVAAGGNYGWPKREGAHCNPPHRPCDPTGLIDPEVEYSHGEGCAIMAGPVYRGTALPALQGATLYGDYCSQGIRAARPDGAGGYTIADLITTPAPIYGFAQESNGEVAVMIGGGVRRIVPATGPEPPPFPQRLSETGCFDPDDPTQPVAGLIPYDVIEPLWSDGAGKQRWLALPDGARIHVNTDGDFALPVGSVLVKSFSLGEQLVETRLFVRHQDGGWAGYSYEWDDAETDALLLPGSKERTVQGQVWTHPSRQQCMSCHTSMAGYTLGLEVRQLNRWITYPQTGRTANQLETFQHIGLLDAPLSAPVRQLPFLSRDTSNDAARGYLHANCSGCHRTQGSAYQPKLLASLSLTDMRVCNVYPVFGDLGISGARVMVPGNLPLSLLSVRPHLVGPGQMPPLARSLVDAYGTQVIDDWIRSWTPSCTGPDSDADAAVDAADNCPGVANASQADADADGIGDACEAVCKNGIDDDGDGKTDYPADAGCASAAAGSEQTRCSDGVDNDGDGRIDSPYDVGCEAPWDVTESSTCEDGVDNNGDGRMDFDGGASRNGGVPLLPPEPLCTGVPFGNLEAGLTTTGCGLGPELAGLLLAISLARRARRSPAHGRRP